MFLFVRRSTRATRARLAGVAAAFASIACTGAAPVSGDQLPAELVRDLDAVPSATWATLAARRVFFAHQSVGANLTDGIGLLLQERPAIGIRVTRSSRPDTVRGGALIHDDVGANGLPMTKTDGFVNALLASGGEPVEIGLQKFCYADFERSTDPDSVFAEYEARVARLREARPDLFIVHVTAPLLVGRRSPKTIAKDLVKGVIGRTTTGDRVSRVRRFNGLMRARYAATGTLFDLASVEAATSRHRASVTGGPESLAAQYATPDGGHLNDLGKRVVAAEFLLFLTGLPLPAPGS